jgi:hypothetical protein
MITFTQEQQKAYTRYITARNKCGLVRVKGYGKQKWVRTADYDTVDVAGLNHPLFELNEDWQEYKEASLAWWAVEPEFRKSSRMSAIRGDYGPSDSWDEGGVRVRDTYSVIQEED